ncbi:MAG: VOC family protein [Candidatus Kariarchaeaceae archaeon]
MNKSYADHLEIPVTDMEKAKKFYGKVFQWNEEGVIQQWDENYILVNLGDGHSSFGLYKVDQVPQENKVVVTMRVDDIEAKLKEIESSGGKTTREKYEIAPEVGFAGNFKDPFGNVWGLHSPPEK